MTIWVELYPFLVGLLLLLAILDLIVGVSNDAVNFLNAATGSQAGTRRLIMIVASIGIMIGALFSSGMMEITRSGIFHPGMFVFSDLIIIFLVVMLTDIIVLDLFNTFSLPTSTTVSIIFELLGASVMIAVFKIWFEGESELSLSSFLVVDSILKIIAGIFISIFIAFTMGMIIQWVTRLIFTFHYQRKMKLLAPLWAGIAMSVLSWFLVVKGLKNNIAPTNQLTVWLDNNSITLFLTSVVFFVGMSFLITRFFSVNILKVVVLYGTFALAMAFASNDLVNFIGVPLAGLEAYKIWAPTKIDPDSLHMEALGNPVIANSLLLAAAGLVMILTLWFSKKARSVTGTEVNLARQQEGLEQFTPTVIAQWIVLFARQINSILSSLMPNKWKEAIDAQFQPLHELQPRHDRNPPAFDLVRASINLVVAAGLIALATANKMPLSTTYVSFMVAMGTSLSDRAWGLGSAVYRVSGVLNVISGWLITGLIAFFIAALFAFVIKISGIAGIVIVVLLAAWSLFKTHRLHRRRSELLTQITNVGILGKNDDLIRIQKFMNRSFGVFQHCLTSMRNDHSRQLSMQKKAVDELRRNANLARVDLYHAIRNAHSDLEFNTRRSILLYDLEQDMIQSLELITKTCADYVRNSLPPLSKAQCVAFEEIQIAFKKYSTLALGDFSKTSHSDADQIYSMKRELFMIIQHHLTMHINGVRSGHYGMRNSNFFISILVEIKDIVAITARMVKVIHGDQGFWPSNFPDAIYQSQ